ncbi:hypothetical protein QBC32DRAFT_254378 [Pseudoneurospora amorphoporcata]|uniref:PNPLA domain-containing protein n=1 Tax=Pseudoneurospora amorphoporcata TaxID=241081 RepID=A0AAN6SHT6_9PEZI|nr:hypothetical protein QBC32DRAFT_254378 [Pseudoneurospora amorphoporcata]
MVYEPKRHHRIDGPVNLLSLDGGGVRGISEVAMLHRIMKRVQQLENLKELPKPCEYFHIMGGTSTGGLVAILLGRLRMSTEEALEKYLDLGKVIFHKSNKKTFEISAKYGPEALVTAVKKLVQERNTSDLMYDPTEEPTTGKVFVCAVNSANISAPQRFRTYASKDKKYSNCKIWEAARATAAAPTFFAPMTVSDNNVQEEFLDGALGYNNPITEVLNEAGTSLDPNLKLGCILSLGCGTKADKTLRKSGRWFGQGLTWGWRIGKVMKDSLTDPDPKHIDVSRFLDAWNETYFRFSVPGAADEVKLPDYKKMKMLKKMTEDYMDRPEVADQIEKVARILAERKTEGAWIGLVCLLEKSAVAMSLQARPMGLSSNFFTGRDDILRKMVKALLSNPDGGSQRRQEYLLWGMGGIGKTQIALRFAEIYGNRFEHVFWLDATNKNTVQQSYHSIALQLGIQTDKVEESQAVVLHWMNASSGKWLLIFDNYAHKGDEYGQYNNITPNKGNLLYSSRANTLLQRLGPEHVSEVREMDDNEAITFFIKTLHRTIVDPEERQQCTALVKELGCLPLAIDQAGANIHMTERNIEDYLTEFRKRRDRLLRERQESTTGIDMEGDPAVYVTFDLSYLALQRQSRRINEDQHARDYETAMKILDIICFYHYDNIPEEMIMRAANWRAEILEKEAGGLQEMPIDVQLGGDTDRNANIIIELDEDRKWDPTWFRRGASILKQFSLVRIDRHRSLSMHVLVHSWARDRLDTLARDQYGFTEKESYALSARCILFESIPETSRPEDFSYRTKLIPHGLALNEHAPPTAVGDMYREAYYDKVWAQANEDVGNWEEAEKFLISSIERYKKNDWLDEGRAIHAIDQLGDFYTKRQNWHKAHVVRLEAYERWRYICFKKDRLKYVREEDGKELETDSEEYITPKEAGEYCQPVILALRRLADLFNEAGYPEGRLEALKQADEMTWESGIKSNHEYFQPCGDLIIETEYQIKRAQNPQATTNMTQEEQDQQDKEIERRKAEYRKKHNLVEEETDFDRQVAYRNEILSSTTLSFQEKTDLLWAHYDKIKDIYGEDDLMTSLASEPLAKLGYKFQESLPPSPSNIKPQLQPPPHLPCPLLVNRHALSLSSQKYGKTHSHTLVCLSHHVQTLFRLNRLGEALKLSIVFRDQITDNHSATHDYSVIAAQRVKTILQVGDPRFNDHRIKGVGGCFAGCTAQSHRETATKLNVRDWLTAKGEVSEVVGDLERGYMEMMRETRQNREDLEMAEGVWKTKEEDGRRGVQMGREEVMMMMQVMN